MFILVFCFSMFGLFVIFFFFCVYLIIYLFLFSIRLILVLICFLLCCDVILHVLCALFYQVHDVYLGLRIRALLMNPLIK